MQGNSKQAQKCCGTRGGDTSAGKLLLTFPLSSPFFNASSHFGPKDWSDGNKRQIGLHKVDKTVASVGVSRGSSTISHNGGTQVNDRRERIGGRTSARCFPYCIMLISVP